MVNAGASWDFTDNFTVFAQGDWLKSEMDAANVLDERRDNQGKAWATYVGAMYSFENGAVLEAGWRHEQMKYKENGLRAYKIKGDTIYATLGLEYAVF